MARITDDYVKYQRFVRPNIDTSHRCVFKCPQCIRQKTSSQEQIRRSFDLEEHNFKKILDYYDNGITFCGQISDPIYHPNFLKLLKMCDGQGKAIRIAQWAVAKVMLGGTKPTAMDGAKMPGTLV